MDARTLYAALAGAEAARECRAAQPSLHSYTLDREVRGEACLCNGRGEPVLFQARGISPDVIRALFRDHPYRDWNHDPGPRHHPLCSRRTKRWTVLPAESPGTVRPGVRVLPWFVLAVGIGLLLWAVFRG